MSYHAWTRGRYCPMYKVSSKLRLIHYPHFTELVSHCHCREVGTSLGTHRTYTTLIWVDSFWL